MAQIPRFVGRMSNTAVNEGDAVVFSVEAVGVPVPFMSWFKDGQLIPEGSNRYRVMTEGGRSSLYIDLAQPDDNAWFQCLAGNIAGSVTNRAKLTVACMCAMITLLIFNKVRNQYSFNDGSLLNLLVHTIYFS